ncbi:MAG: hypothetical protein J7M08_04295 [Planctomycetes bacterium]|nr:hypothetical protein [Planctomycetota bacterium]
MTIWGAVPLLVCDVWEHAYYLQCEDRRADYVDSYFHIIGWADARGRLAQAREFQGDIGVEIAE